jgi:hypothetical protein
LKALVLIEIKMVEELGDSKCKAPYLSYNENLSEDCMEIKTLQLNVLTELSGM